MQFPVPQFTDVEDKIIGSLTIKQFGIIFGAGVFVFLGFSATKSIIVLVFFIIIFGIPGLALAFAKINGRPVYNSLGKFANFISSPKILVFHKEAENLQSNRKLKDAGLAKGSGQGLGASYGEQQGSLRAVQALLIRTEQAEQDILGQQQ